MLGAVSEQDGHVFLMAIKVLEFFIFLYSVFTFCCCSCLTMGVHVTREVLEEILRLRLEPIEGSLNFKDDEHRKLLEGVVKLERTVKALELENNALKAQLNTAISKV